MTTASETSFPPAALDWLVGGEDARVLALGRSCLPLMGLLARRGDRLTANDPDPGGVRALLQRAPAALPTVSDATRLPFVPCAFDAVLVNQSLHALDLTAALPEIARVLRPGGHLAIAYTIRDDSVPWVKRLVGLVRAVDADAMTGDYGTDSVAAVAASPYFPTVERQQFRLWVPVSKDALLAMVQSRFPDLADDRRADLLRDVAQLYASSARVPEPLLLPYRIACWRAWVDHSELSAPLELPDAGLSITL